MALIHFQISPRHHLSAANLSQSPFLTPSAFASREQAITQVRLVPSNGTTPTGRPMWQMIGVLAELERSLITERTRAEAAAVRKRGVKFGRKPKLTPEQIAHARKLLDDGESRQYVAGLLNVGRVTLYRALAG